MTQQDSSLTRLDKLVRSAGAASRRELRAYLAQKRVSVDGQTATACAQLCRPDSVICIDGVTVRRRTDLYLMLNKSAGYLSATRSAKEPTVLELLPPVYRGRQLFPVGRLDLDTEGLLLLTSDGDFCHRVIDPAQQITKTYYARLQGVPAADAAARFARGLELDGGVRCRAARLERLADGRSVLVQVHEGKRHQVKRMMAAVGAKVIYLRRLAIGNLLLDRSLQAGGCRPLSQEELQQIFLPRAPEFSEILEHFSTGENFSLSAACQP